MVRFVCLVNIMFMDNAVACERMNRGAGGSQAFMIYLTEYPRRNLGQKVWILYSIIELFKFHALLYRYIRYPITISHVAIILK